MQSNSEARIVRLETLVKWVQDRLRSLTNRVDALDNSVRQMSGMQYNWGGGGSGGPGVMFCVTPASGSWASAGPPPGSSPGGPFTADVYKISGGGYVSVAGSASVYNGFPSSPGNSKVVAVCPNGDGTYSVVGESCA